MKPKKRIDEEMLWYHRLLFTITKALMIGGIAVSLIKSEPITFLISVGIYVFIDYIQHEK